MRRLIRLAFEGSQAAAFLLVAATLAPGWAEPAGSNAAVPEPPRMVLAERAPAVAEMVVPERPKPVAEPAPQPEPDPEPQPPHRARLAIGFNPREEQPPVLPPPVQENPGPAAAVAPPGPDPLPPMPIRRDIPVLGSRTVIYRHGWGWYGPRVFTIAPPVPRPPAPARPRAVNPPRPRGGANDHTIRLHWERDVEQYRALDRAGYRPENLRPLFGAKYDAVRTAALSEARLSQLPTPPQSYRDALAREGAIRP